MSKSKKVPDVKKGPRPPHGGRFIRDPETGELTCVEQTKPAGAPAKAAPAAGTESGSGTAESGGGAAGPQSGSTGEEQEG